MIPPIATQFIGGETVEDAVSQANELNDRGIIPILNQLGEHYQSEEPVRETVNEYKELISQLSNEGTAVAISLKPTQLGLEISKDLFEQNAKEIVKKASESNIFVWLDMESSHTVDETLDVYRDLLELYPKQVGICLQANLRRTKEDLQSLFGTDAAVRLVKGAYDEDENTAFIDQSRITQNLVSLAREANGNIYKLAIGSHDEDVINESVTRAGDTDVEVQMLKGVREDYQDTLVRDGYTVGQYIPYGTEWFSYTTRRLKERPRNILLLGRSVIERFTP